MLDLSVNQSKEPNSNWRRQPKYGVFVHYLALTFSTLLSSQVSGAHRAGSSSDRLGATRSTLRSAITSSQIGVSSSEPTRTHPVEPLGVRWSRSGWFPASRPPQITAASRTSQKAYASLLLQDRWVNGSRAYDQLRRILTAPTVRLPRRTMT